VVHPPGKDQILVPYLLEALEAERAALERELGLSVPGRVRVEILDGVRSLSRLTGLTEEEIRTSGTVAVAKYDKLMLLSPRLLVKGYDWLDTAAHEYVHHVVTTLTLDRMPVWLHERIAKWCETLWRGKGGESWSPYSAAILEQALQRKKLVTFEEMYPSVAKLTSERATLAFAEVLLAVEHLVQQGGPGALAKVVAQVADGVDAREAMASAAGRSWPHFEAGWRAYMAARPMPRGGERERIRLRFRDDPKQASGWSEWAEIPDAQARGFARLGQIFRERGKWVAARQEYGKGYARVGPKWAVLADQYALAMMMSGDDPGAERVLADALRNSPGYAALHVHLARLLLKRGDFAAARTQLVLANREDPFDPEIHAGLAKALAALSDPTGASREERFARILAGPGPQHP
ncbi:MAG TPA: tetratricopeptide repeat protein, partial [Anaeromyxobacteraceae bacterium]|nr:tetratricopeptide repeat protein [Anaeromyxobacteraceae bacterium]